MTRWRAFLAELRRPERLTGYPGWLNQLGHREIGVLAVGPVAHWPTADALAWALIVAVAYLCIIEGRQLARTLGTRRRRLWRDSLTDTGFVLAGGAACALAGVWWALVAVGVLALAYGVWTTET